MKVQLSTVTGVRDVEAHTCYGEWAVTPHGPSEWTVTYVPTGEGIHSLAHGSADAMSRLAEAIAKAFPRFTPTPVSAPRLAGFIRRHR